MNALTALTWEYWRRNRFRIVIALALAVSCGPFAFWVFYEGSAGGQEKLRDLNVLLPFFVLQTMIVCMFVDYGNMQGSERRPAAHLRLVPLPTWLTAGWQLLCSTVALLLVLLTTCTLIVSAGMPTLPGFWPFLLLDCTLLAILQGFAWCSLVSGQTRGIVAAVFYVSLLVLWLRDMTRACLGIPGNATGSAVFTRGQHVWLLLAAYVVTVSLAIWMAVLDRRGARLPSLGAALERTLRRIVAARQREGMLAFRSQTRAQFWLEWRTRGWVLPAVCAVVSGFLLLWVRDAGILAVVLVLCVPMAAGSTAMATGRENSRRDGTLLSTYYATRPLGERGLGSTLLGVNALSIALGVFIIFFPFLLHVGPSAYYQIIVGLNAWCPGTSSWPLAFCLPLLSFMLSWAIMNTIMAAALSGRTWPAISLWVVPFVVTPFALELAAGVSGAQIWVERFVAAVAVLVFVACVVLCLKACQMRLVSRLTSGLVLTMAGIIAVVTVLYVVSSGDLLARASMVGVLALLVFLPFASFPLALYANRHR